MTRPYDAFDEISKYTSVTAVEDVMLFDILEVNPNWGPGIIRYVTQNLMSKGYISEDEPNLPNLIDLLNQANEIVRKESESFTLNKDTMYSGKIEGVNGKRLEIWIVLNETNKYTIMLPEDN